MKKGKPVIDKKYNANKNNYEKIPLKEDVDEYFKREVQPYVPDAWVDIKEATVGYEIPMTKYFFEYKKPEESEAILNRIVGLEDEISTSLRSLFDKEN